MRYETYVERHEPRWPVVIIRLYLGVFFLAKAVLFITEGLVNARNFEARLVPLLEFGQIPGLDHYFRLLARAPSVAQATIVLAAYLMIGIALLLGLYVRPAGILAVIFLLHRYFFGFLGPADPLLRPGHTLSLRLVELLILLMLVMIWTAAGRKWGLDGIVWRRQLKREFTWPDNPNTDPLAAQSTQRRADR